MLLFLVFQLSLLEPTGTVIATNQKKSLTVAAQGTREFLGHGVSISNIEICIIL